MSDTAKSDSPKPDSLKSRLIVAVIRLLAWLSLSRARALGAFIGSRLNGRSLAITERNVELCYPQLSADERRQLCQQSMIELGHTLSETGMAWCWPSDKVLATITDVQQQALLDQAIADQQGVLLLAPHIGNWEVLGLYLGQHYLVTSMFKPPQLAGLGRLMKSARERNGAELVPTDARGIKAQLKALKQGKLVALLPDQEPDGRGGEFAPFFNQPALTMTLAHNLIQRTGCRVIFALAKRNSQGFEIIFQAADKGIYSTDSHTSLAALNLGVQACIDHCPAQYQWEYKRFKATPAGMPRRYPGKKKTNAPGKTG